MEHMPNNSSPGEQPLYNIGVVSRMTGISVATLRAWERRYGFPSSGRTAGGHRLYSEKDMVQLRWVKGQIEQGMQTAQAIQALRRQEAGERIESLVPGRLFGQAGALLAPVPSSGPASASVPRPPGMAEPAMTVAGAGPLLGYREDLTQALLRYDTAAADQILGKVLLDYGLDDLIFQVIDPVFVEIGRGWQEGRVSVAMEHLTTHYLRHRLLLWMLSGPPLYPVRPVVLACAPDELHEGSLLIMGALLRRRRWPVAYLGQTVPLADLAGLVADIQPPIVVMVAMTEGPAARMIEWPRYLPDAGRPGRPVVAFGGRIFTDQPEWRDRVPGLFLGPTLEDGVERVDEMLQRLL